MVTDFPTAGFAIDAETEELYQGTGIRVRTARNPTLRGSTTTPPTAILRLRPPAIRSTASAPGNSRGKGIAVDGHSHVVYVANSGTDDVAVFADARPIVTTGAPDATDSTVTLTGHIDPAGRGDISQCYFEYGFDETYGARSRANPIRRRIRPGRTSPGRPTSPRRSPASPRGPPATTGSSRRTSPKDAASVRRRDLHQHRAAGDHRARGGTTHRHDRRPGREDHSQRPRHPLPLRIRDDPRIRAAAPRFRTASSAASYRSPAGRSPPGRADTARRLPLPARRRKRKRRRPPSRTTPSTSTRPTARTRTSASRPRRTSCPTAAPTSSSRPPTPAAPSSIPRARIRATRRAPSRFSFIGAFSTIPGAGGQPDRRQRRPLRRDPHEPGLDQPLRRLARERSAGRRRAADGPAGLHAGRVRRPRDGRERRGGHLRGRTGCSPTSG